MKLKSPDRPTFGVFFIYFYTYIYIYTFYWTCSTITLFWDMFLCYIITFFYYSGFQFGSWPDQCCIILHIKVFVILLFKRNTSRHVLAFQKATTYFRKLPIQSIALSWLLWDHLKFPCIVFRYLVSLLYTFFDRPS